MDSYTFTTEHLVPEAFIGKIFVLKKHAYRILNISKAWGESPVILGYIEVQDEKGNVSELLMTCTCDFRTSIWEVTITFKP